MSSRFTPESIGGRGIMADSEDNPAQDANQVYVYYCSSDSWVGRKSSAVLTSADGVDEMSMHFRGHSILEAMVDTLMTASAASDDGIETLPNLADATAVLWTGVSAGSNGATQHMDWFAAKFDPEQTRVAGVFDAGFGPEFSEYEPDVGDAFTAYSEARWSTVWTPHFDAFVDESCAAHPANQGDNAYQCGSSINLKLNHITTPFFQRLDIRDSVGSQGPISLGATMGQYAHGSIATLTALTSITTTALEADQITVTPGVYGPNCKQHVAITNNKFFMQTTVDDDDGVPQSFASALDAWLAGETVFAVDEQPAATSTCAATTEDKS